MAKIYLSPAAHEHDNPCSYSSGCSENTHCNLYVDWLEKHLIACGFEVKRNPKDRTGDRLKEAIAESNTWGADLHYIAHTNAGGKSYSLLMVYDDGTAYTYAQMLAAMRRDIYDGSVKVNIAPQWAELSQTTAPAIYDETVFHDNLSSITWYHNNLDRIAENTCKAICKMFNVEYRGLYTMPGYYVKVGPFENETVARAYFEILQSAHITQDNASQESPEPSPVKSFNDVSRFRSDVVFSTAANALNRINALPLSSDYRTEELRPTQTYYDGKVCRYENIGFFHIDSVTILE
nr:MAG TPA: Cell wall hydrolase autolysin [Caudoviricetes sp.]